MQSQDAKIFNVPIGYIKESMGKQFHRQLLAFWLCVKMKSGDSLYHPSIIGIKTDFRCGHTLAKRIYEFVTAVGDNNLLFTYNPKTNGLVARTWKLNPETRQVRFSVGGVAKMKYCGKVKTPEILSIRNVMRELRCALLKVSIDEKKRSDKFLSGSDKYSSCLDRSLALNQKKLGRIINAHRTTASRLLKHMESEGVITVSRKCLQNVRDLKHDGKWLVPEEDVRRYGLDKRKLIINRYTGIGSVRDANEYFPKKRTSFNVIINATERIRPGVSVNFKARRKNDIPHDHADVFYCKLS